MRVLAFGDLHGSLKAYRELQAKVKKHKPDVLFCLGDFTIFDSGIAVLLRKLNDLGKPMLVIHGNHEDEKLVERLCEQQPNLLYVHGKVVELGEFKIIAHGGGGFYGSGKASRDSGFEQLVRSTKKDILGKIILLTHAPPRGTRLDMSAWLHQHVGCSSYTDFIKKYKPALALCGHMHENFGLKDKIGKTLIVNPGPAGMVFQI